MFQPVRPLVVLAILQVCLPIQRPQPAELPACETADARGNCTLYKASIVQLLARPEVFDSKRVRVTGFIHFEFEGNGIYLHREDYEQRLYSNGLWVQLNERYKPVVPCQNRYVLIEGLFEGRNQGHMGLWSGAITDITRCINWR